MWPVLSVLFVSNTATFLVGWQCGWVGASSSSRGHRGPVLLITLGVYVFLESLLALIVPLCLALQGRSS
jgi:hypothetical protein